MPTKRSSSKKKKKTTPKSQPIGKEKMKELFDRIDIDGNKEIDCHELLQATFLLRLDHLDVVDIAKMIQEADLDGNGTIDFYEFATVMEHCTKKNSDWEKAGRAARLFKGLDQSLANVHKHVHQSSSKTEDGETIPIVHRWLGDIIGFMLFFPMFLSFLIVKNGTDGLKIWAQNVGHLGFLFIPFNLIFCGGESLHFGHYIFGIKLVAADTGKPVEYNFVMAIFRSILCLFPPMFVLNILIQLSGSTGNMLDMILTWCSSGTSSEQKIKRNILIWQTE